jgi:hypothetical protein
MRQQLLSNAAARSKPGSSPTPSLRRVDVDSYYVGCISGAHAHDLDWRDITENNVHTYIRIVADRDKLGDKKQNWYPT